MRSALELVTTAHPAAANRGSISAAIDASKAAKMILGAPSGLAGDTRISATRAGIGVFIFQRAASPYERPSERSEAATHATSNHGWCSSIWIKRCPTTPVAPRIPTGVFVCIRRLDFTTGHDRTRAQAPTPPLRNETETKLTKDGNIAVSAQSNQ